MFVNKLFTVVEIFGYPYVGAAFLKAKYPLAMSIGKLRNVENSVELPYWMPVLGSLYLALKERKILSKNLTTATVTSCYLHVQHMFCLIQDKPLAL